MTDHHAHVGWYSDGYHVPQEVWLAERDAGITDVYVSSTSTCVERYKLVVQEIRQLLRLGGEHVHPVLWLTPRMMKTWGIRYMLHAKVGWQMVKMHWQLHREWFYNPRLTEQAMAVARKLDVPVLLHTGREKECRPSAFCTMIQSHPDILFTLAHGRPADETIEVMNACPNTLVDTAFMPVEDVERIAKAGLAGRMRFGTDIPIHRLYYPETSTADYIRSRIEEQRNYINI